MKSYDKGTAVLIEVEYKQQTPFGSVSYFDPTSPKITITDRDGAIKIDAADLTKSETGKYYYICQTGDTWLDGTYKATVTGSDGSYNGRDVASVFSLK